MPSPHQHTLEMITAELTQHFSPTHLEVIDESHLHAKHVEAKKHPKAGHFKVVIVSSDFVGKSPVQRHRMVYECLAELMSGSIHALSLETKTPTENTEKSR